MKLDDLTIESQRGSGLLLLSHQTAKESERDALKALIHDAAEKVCKANNAGYLKGCEEGQQKAISQQALARQSTSLPHGVVTGEDGRRTLYVNEFKVRSIDHANRLRGLRADQVCPFRDWGMPQRIRDYLEQEVLAPIIADAKARNGYTAQELGSAMGVAQIPPKDPPHQSADWALWVVKRLEAVEERAHLTLPEVEQLFKRVERLEKGEAALEKVNTGHARRLHNLEVGHEKKPEWERAVSARLNAIEIWKNSELATLLTEKVAEATLEKAQTGHALHVETCIAQLQAQIHDLQRHAHTGELPRGHRR